MQARIVTPLLAMLLYGPPPADSEQSMSDQRCRTANQPRGAQDNEISRGLSFISVGTMIHRSCG
jgi:hypothetical protein